MGWWGRAAGALLRGAAGRRPPRGLRYSSGRGPPAPPPVSELDKADAWLLRKAHETGQRGGPRAPPFGRGRSCGGHGWGRGAWGGGGGGKVQLQLLPVPSSGFLSWFRNGLLATGVGVISYVQSDVGREAAYGKSGPVGRSGGRDRRLQRWHYYGGESRLRLGEQKGSLRLSAAQADPASDDSFMTYFEPLPNAIAFSTKLLGAKWLCSSAATPP